MSTNPHQPPPRPTLEDLLRFKRAERPPPEFWAEFDRGLRQKQLAALMKRSQGWSRVRPVLVRGLRWAVPATAAAAVALVILQIPNGSNTKQEPQVAVVSPRPAPVAEQPAPLPVAEVASAVAQARAEETHSQAETLVAGAESHPMAGPTQVAVAVLSEHALPWSAASLGYANTSDFRAGEFKPVRQAARETRRPNSSWTSRFTEMVRDLSAEQSEARVLQLASMDLSVAHPYAVAPAPVGAAQLVAGSGRSSRTLSEREFRDLDSRFGVKGSSLSIKF